jgi:hypothetical protein
MFVLLRRITEHLRAQNWIAIALDLIVVVVGVFIAFQVERWYEFQRLVADERQHLQSLAQDFEQAHENISWVISRLEIAQTAAQELLELEPNDPITSDEFYRLVADVQRNGTLEPKRRTYDALISTAQIEAIKDKSLTSDLGDFFSFMDRQLRVRGRWDNELANTWFPYITTKIDHVAMVKFAHPEDTGQLTPTHTQPKFKELLGTDEFEGIIVLRWHFARDRAFGVQQLLDRVEAIQRKIEANLANT